MIVQIDIPAIFIFDGSAGEEDDSEKWDDGGLSHTCHLEPGSDQPGHPR